MLTIKNYQTPSKVPKARYVAQGYDDQDNKFIVHEMNTILSPSIRIILSAAACMNWKLFSHDVTQAYCQSMVKFSRKVYPRPRKEDMEIIGVKSDELLELRLPHYGLCDAGDYWGATLERHITEDLNMVSMKSDSAVYTWERSGKTVGVTGTYVDDCLNAGHESFQEHTNRMLKHVEAKPRVWESFDNQNYREEFLLSLTTLPY